MKGPTLRRQISELQAIYREREVEAARQVRTGRMREAEAVYRLEGLQAAIDSLYWLERNRTIVLAAAMAAKAAGETAEAPGS